MSRKKKELLLQLLYERSVRKARADLLCFTRHNFMGFETTWFHENYYSILNDFIHKKYKKVAVFIPPQHGKSLGSTVMTPSFLVGTNPDNRIAIVSYSATKAGEFNRQIQRVIDSHNYNSVFPNTRLATPKDKAVRTSEMLEIPNHIGSIKTIGVGGALTGSPVDILIMDDLYKDAEQAWSPVQRAKVQDWYTSVALTRLHNDSQQLMVFTRWHEEDLGGFILSQDGIYSEDNPNGWVVVTFPAIKIGEPNDIDPREEGEALWKERHSKEKLLSIREKDKRVFDSLYQQNPKPLYGLMYDKGFRTYTQLPSLHGGAIKAYTDTADTGQDYLCCIVYVETKQFNYVLDLVYTQAPMETTEGLVADLMGKYNVSESIIESNNGGRGFARNVERLCREQGNSKTYFRWFHQSKNKESRILTNSSEVQNLTLFPEGWETMYPKFCYDLLNYNRIGKNKHDDAPDALTGTIENRGVETNIDYNRLKQMFY